MKKAVAILLFLTLVICAFSGCVEEEGITTTPTISNAYKNPHNIIRSVRAGIFR